LKHGGLESVVISLPKVKAREGPIVLHHIMLSHIVQVKCAIGSTERAKSVSQGGCQGAAHMKAGHQRGFDLGYTDVLPISGSVHTAVRMATKEPGADGEHTSIPGLLVRLSQDKDLDWQCSLEYTHGLLAGFWQSLGFDRETTD
jgi:hypothetical protein